MPDMTRHEQTNIGVSLRSKAEGALIALAAGDALGWPQEIRTKTRGRQKLGAASREFRHWTRRSGGRYFPYEEEIHAGDYSDDTQLTLAVARCRTIGGSGWWTALTRTELPIWTAYERGGGGATKRAAEHWLQGVSPWKAKEQNAVKRYFEAGGNGVAMRVLPHAIFYAEEDEATIMLRDVLLDGATTHGHPRALVGAAAYAYAAWWLLRSKHTIGFGEVVDILLEKKSLWGGFDGTERSKNGWLEAANLNNQGNYESLWCQVVEEMNELLKFVKEGLAAGAIADDEEVLRSIGCLGATKGAGTVSAAASIYLCARYAVQPEHGVLKAAFTEGMDTDTVAAMTGGLMGCLAGIDWLPRAWFKIQDCEYLRHMALDISLGPNGIQENSANLRTIDSKSIDALRSAINSGDREKLNFDGKRSVDVVDLIAPKALSKTTLARTWKLRTSDGQTIYITKLSRSGKQETLSPKGEEPVQEESTLPMATKIVATAIGIKLSVADIDRTGAFYEKTLGLIPVKKSSHFLSFGPIALVSIDYAKKLSEGAVDYFAGPGRHRMKIHVSDLQTAYQRVKNSQGLIVRGMARMPWGEFVFHCKDPEGNLIEVTDRH